MVGLRNFCFSASVALMALVHPASAQDDRLKELVIPPEDTIRLQLGETRVFQFGESVKNILAPGDVVEVTPQSDRTFGLRGGQVGQTIATALGNDGHVVRRVLIVVGGRVVKIYGTDKDGVYVTQICDEFGCDTPPEKAGPPPKSVTVRTPMRGGGFVERTW